MRDNLAENNEDLGLRLNTLLMGQILFDHCIAQLSREKLPFWSRGRRLLLLPLQLLCVDDRRNAGLPAPAANAAVKFSGEVLPINRN